MAKTIDFRVVDGIELQHGRSEQSDFDPHFHEEYQILVVTEGAFRLETARHVRIVERGMVCVINPEEAHSGVHVGNGWSCRNMYVPREVVARLCQKGGTGTISFGDPVIDDPLLAQELVTAHEEAMMSGEGATLRLAIGAFLDVYAEGRPSNEPKGGIGRALAHLRARYVAGAPLAELATVAELSPYHFIRVFSRETGLTPLVFQNNLRLARAKRSLRNQVRGAQAAIDSGYYDQSHLTRALQRTHGLTPGAFRRAFERAIASNDSPIARCIGGTERGSNA